MAGDALLRPHQHVDGRTPPLGWLHDELPIYSGILAGLLGSALVAGQVRGLIACALLLAAYPRKHDLEEAALRGRLVVL